MRRDKSLTITRDMVVTQDSRDVGRTYVITEMSASSGEKWAARAWLAVARSGAEIPPEFLGSGWAGIAVLSLQALRFSRYEEIEPLMDELFKCVRFLPDRQHPDRVRDLFEDDIEEIETRVLIRKEVLDLHTGPFVEGVRSRFPSHPKPPPEDEQPPSSPTRTSRARSAR